MTPAPLSIWTQCHWTQLTDLPACDQSINDSDPHGRSLRTSGSNERPLRPTHHRPLWHHSGRAANSTRSNMPSHQGVPRSRQRHRQQRTRRKSQSVGATATATATVVRMERERSSPRVLMITTMAVTGRHTHPTRSLPVRWTLPPRRHCLQHLPR